MARLTLPAFGNADMGALPSAPGAHIARLVLAAFGGHLAVQMLIYAAIGVSVPQSVLWSHFHGGGAAALVGIAALCALATAAFVDGVIVLCWPTYKGLSPRQHATLWCAIAGAQASQALVSLNRGLPWPLIVMLVWLAIASLAVAAFHLAVQATRWRCDAGQSAGLE